jgi:hypothetical protein
MAEERMGGGLTGAAVSAGDAQVRRKMGSDDSLVELRRSQW